MATKRKQANKPGKKTGKKATKKATKKTNKGTTHVSLTGSFRAARAEFFEKLSKQPNITFLSREESQRILEDTDLDGCIARPKNWKYEGPDSEDEESPQV